MAEHQSKERGDGVGRVLPEPAATPALLLPRALAGRAARVALIDEELEAMQRCRGVVQREAARREQPCGLGASEAVLGQSQVEGDEVDAGARKLRGAKEEEGRCGEGRSVTSVGSSSEMQT